MMDVEASLQRVTRVESLASVLDRRLPEGARPEIRIVELPVEGFRTTVKAGVVGGQAGFRGARSTAVTPVEECVIAHPLVEELLVHGFYGEATDVMIRVGAATGERMAHVSPSATGVVLPEDVRIIGEDELAAGRRSWIFEELAGRRWRISAHSFFQTRPDGALALVDVVRAEVRRVVGDGPVGRLVDACAGVGLFAGTIPSEHVTAIEWSRSACADARVNLADREAKIVGSAIDRWRPTPADVVIADPSRPGLGRSGVEIITRTNAPVVILISCDSAAGARDLQRFVEAGYRIDAMSMVDMFPHTARIELVSTLVRGN